MTAMRATLAPTPSPPREMRMAAAVWSVGSQMNWFLIVKKARENSKLVFQGCQIVFLPSEGVVLILGAGRPLRPARAAAHGHGHALKALPVKNGFKYQNWI